MGIKKQQLRNHMSLARKIFSHSSILVLLCALCLCTTAFPQFYRPSKEFRTINTDLYEVSVQKNGRTDLKTIAGESLAENAFPMVQFAGDEEPRPLPVDARYTARAEVNDHLGQGQGIQFGKKDCEWYIRAYPSKPFLTVQVVYVNTGKSPVRVEKLIPWAVGAPRSGYVSLGPGAADVRMLENGRLFRSFNDYPEVSKGKSFSQYNLAAFNPATGRSLIAGFLTNLIAYTQIVMERTDAAPENGFDLFRAECVYDPPVEVQPGERLQSEVLYLGILEHNPFDGLERYGKAVAVMNGVRDERPFMPNGWDSWNTHYHTHIDEASMLANLDYIDANLKRFGWTHFAIDAGWERGLGDWEPNPERFPHGMKYMADEIHKRGMKASIWLDPFTIPNDSDFAKAHPDWLMKPLGLGRFVIGGDKSVLDPSHPDAYAYLRDLTHKICVEWGFDGLAEADFVYYLLAAGPYHDPKMTKVEIQRLGMRALREGMGTDKSMVTMTPQPINAVYAQCIRVGRDCSPLWRGTNINEKWGCVDALTNAIRRWYFTPHLYVCDPDCAYFGHEAERTRWDLQSQPALTWDQSIAWLTGQALAGGAVKIGDPFVELDARETAALRKLLPSLERPARPIDVFQQDSPRIWHLPVVTTVSRWDIVGCFNWDAANPARIALKFAELGLDPNGYYTVYDFWNETYRGIAQGALDIEVPPGAVRLLGLRAFEGHPMLIASDRHITQGAMDHTALAWDEASKTLSGTFTAVADADYALHVLTPEPYVFKEAATVAGPIQTTLEDRVTVLRLHTAAEGPVTWSVTVTQQ